MNRKSNRSKEVFLVVTNQCNLHCSYCYESVKNKQVMSAKQAKEVISEEIKNIDKFEGFYIIFHGGEPFLAFQEVKAISEWIWNTYPEENITCLTTTNGTILTPEIREWLLQNKRKFVPILSIDGTRKTHNINRSNSYDKIDKTFFLKNWPSQPVKMTISPKTLPYLFDDYISLHNQWFKVNPSLAKDVNWSPEKDIPIFAREMKKLADFYVENPDIIPCELINISMSDFAPNVTVPFNRACGAGDNVVAYDVCGNKFPCHTFIGAPGQAYDNKEIENLFTLLNKNDGLLLSEKCHDCAIYSCCSPCYGLNYANRGNMGNFEEVYCRFNQIRVWAAADMYSRIITSNLSYKVLENKSPSEISLIVSGIKEVFSNKSHFAEKKF